jgi:hypothetical protein
LQGDELALVLRFGGACEQAVMGGSARGEACETSLECDAAHGYACVKKADSGDGTCQIPEVVDPGRDCDEAPQTCSAGFVCDGRHCVQTAERGEPCVIHEQCGDDGYCDENGQCAARHAVNDSCGQDVECARGICSELDGQLVCTDRVRLSRADPLCATLR